MEPTPGETSRTFKMLAVGAAPAAISYGLLLLAETTGQTLLFFGSFVLFGFTTPMVVANAKRRGSVVVALLLAGAFLGMQSGVDQTGFNPFPWLLFAWGLFPSLAITLCLRLSSSKVLPFTLPLALLASVVALLLVPESLIAGVSLIVLLADMLILRKYGKMASETPPAGQ